jgi:predicted phage tail protein
MKKIKLLGKLGRLFGREWILEVKNASQAIKAIAANAPKFVDYLRESETDGVGYRVVIDKDNPLGIDADQFNYPIDGTMTIAPIVQGAGGGFGRILLGGALIAAAFFMPASISFLGVALTSTSVGLLGAALVFGGISQLLSPQSKTPNTETEKKESFLFDRSAGSSSQGIPIPIGYGERLLTDLIVISQSNIVEQIPV